jgi:hypothetical protein
MIYLPLKALPGHIKQNSDVIPRIEIKILILLELATIHFELLPY